MALCGMAGRRASGRSRQRRGGDGGRDLGTPDPTSDAGEASAAARRALQSSGVLVDALLSASGGGFTATAVAAAEAAASHLTGNRGGNDLMTFLNEGSWLTKLTAKHKSNRRYFIFCSSTKCLRYEGSRKWSSSKAKFRIGDVVDVRSGFQTDTFNKMSHKLQESCCFSIIFRSRRPLDLVADCPDIRDVWLKGMSYAKWCHDQLMLQQDEQALVKDLFYSADVTSDEMLQFDEVWQLLQKLSAKISRDDAKKQFLRLHQGKTADRKNNPSLSLQEFIQLYHELCRRPEVDELFDRLKEKGRPEVTPEGLQRFMIEEQKETGFSLDDARKLIEDCQATFAPPQKGAKVYLTLNGFYFLLNSKHFNVFSESHGVMYQDMTHPMSHYFISSSHNTYLTGDQLTSRSSIEAYIQALMDGCRCVEMDCYDGDGNEPVVYHGYTLTTKLLFRDIVEDAVRPYAFYRSEYPVILSFENHCSIEQQEVMASILRSALGDKLYIAPVDESLQRLPSPEELKGKILIKSKKNPSDATLAPASTPSSVYDELDAALADDSSVDSVGDAPDGFSQATKAKKMGVAPGLSSLVNYLQAVPFKGTHAVLEHGKFHQMSSYSEKKMLGLIKDSPADLVRLTELQLCRTYPKGTRTDSSNYCPVTMWNVGAQIVALNFQTSDEAMQIYRGKFRDNGGCGYLLKPNFMCDPKTDFNPCDETTFAATRQYFRVKIISGYHLPKPEGSENDKDIVDPFVIINIFGTPSDCIEMRTEKVKDNGLNPQWNEELFFYVNVPQLALIHFVVRDSDLTTSDLIGQFCLPVTSLQRGYRHVKLESSRGKPLGPASLFIHVSQQQFPFPESSNGQLKSKRKRVKTKSLLTDKRKSVASDLNGSASATPSVEAPQAATTITRRDPPAADGHRKPASAAAATSPAAGGNGSLSSAELCVRSSPAVLPSTGEGASQKHASSLVPLTPELVQLESNL